jgi:hypothetical protein
MESVTFCWTGFPHKKIINLTQILHEESSASYLPNGAKDV